MPKKVEDWSENSLMRHYKRGTEDMDTRRTRENGWNAVLDNYMGEIPDDWPFSAQVTEPLVRTVILEKTGRLLNAKLRGKLTPREKGDTIKTRVMNAVLDYQWDNADNGGSMLEKLAMADQIARLFGAAFALIYWDTEKDCNEFKLIDPRDILIDPSATHIKNARWVQVREWTTKKKLEDMGYSVGKLEKDDSRDTVYNSTVKDNRGLDFRSEGELELITEWTPDKEVKFLPKHGKVLKERKNWRKRIPVSMLRYYPLPDDIYGDSECEPVLSIARTVNWFLSAFVEGTNIDLAPPIAVPESGVQLDTIEYTPRAIWIANDPNRLRQMTTSTAAIQSFNNVYPMLKAAFGTAMGQQSLGVSNVKGYQTDKTATEIQSLEQQQNVRDQYNQLYLAEFLKDVMMQWVKNIQVYLFDDETKNTKIIRIVGRDEVKALQELGLSDKEVPEELMNEFRTAAMGGNLPPEAQQMMNESALPKYPVVMNPEDMDEAYDIQPKLKLSEQGDEADLIVERGDEEGVYDYIPDVKSMAAGVLVERQRSQREAFNLVTSPAVQQLLTQSGMKTKVVELLTPVLESVGYASADSLFEPISETSGGLGGVNGQPGLPTVPPTMAGAAVPPPSPQPQGMPLAR